MGRNNSDRFEVSGINPFSDAEHENFFLAEGARILPPEPMRRLNDYDSHLLEEDAYKEVSDDFFKLEYKIARIEEELKELDNRIQSARDIYDYNQIESLSERKTQLKAERENLVKMYNDMSLPAKISDGILNLFGNKFKNNLSVLQKAINSFSEACISKMPKKFASAIELKKSLSKLESINKNVDELIGMNIPYGENIDKYEQLSKYIIRANSIQSNISKFIK